VLSGGEKSRVALGRILLKRVPCLLLDEPTNHLDFQTVEALTVALKKFAGTLIVVSHDRGFIRRVASQILDVEGGGVHLYPGTYDEYVWRLQKLLAGNTVEDAPVDRRKKSAETPPPPAPAVSPGQLKKERDRKLRNLERKIVACEDTIHRLEHANAIANDKIASGHGRSDEWVSQLASNTQELQKVEAEWLALSSEKESLEKN
jgi:ATP-binding cassette subfamily F protein 3